MAASGCERKRNETVREDRTKQGSLLGYETVVLYTHVSLLDGTAVPQTPAREKGYGYCQGKHKEVHCQLLSEEFS